MVEPKLILLSFMESECCHMFLQNVEFFFFIVLIVESGSFPHLYFLVLCVTYCIDEESGG